MNSNRFTNINVGDTVEVRSIYNSGIIFDSGVVVKRTKCTVSFKQDSNGRVVTYRYQPTTNDFRPFAGDHDYLSKVEGN